eukprot:7496819-Karenia_brevis.AAC.1
MPWAEQVVDDLVVLKRFHTHRLSSLPCPTVHLEPWFEFMCAFPSEWKELVAMYFDDGSMDENTTLTVDGIETGAFFRCTLCLSKNFKNSKALAQHMRIKHKVTNPVNKYIDGSGICPACGVNFFSRAKVLTHASETRMR